MPTQREKRLQDIRLVLGGSGFVGCVDAHMVKQSEVNLSDASSGEFSDTNATALLKRCHDVLTRALYSEDGLDPDTALPVIHALEGKLTELGKSSSQMVLERWWDELCEAVGIDPGDERDPMPLVKERLREHGELRAAIAARIAE